MTPKASRKNQSRPFPPRFPGGRSGYSVWFVMVVAGFITCLLTANIIAVKIADFWGHPLPAAVIIFPLSYIFGDILTEVYGYRQARRVIWLGFACNLLMVLSIWGGQVLPAAGFWPGQPAYDQILGYAPRLLGASFLAYLAGEFANSFVLARMKIATQGRWLWTRTIGSTVVGQALDSAIFITVAFAGTMPNSGLAQLAFTQWLFKSAYEAVATPFTYLVAGFLKRREGADYFDTSTDFNPIALRDK
jgi:queuosine precursor transporter